MIRKTRQRDAVMQSIKEAGRPLTPTEIYEHAQRHYPEIGLRTVYRHINDLIDKHEIIGVDYPSQPIRYEAVRGQNSVPHMVCRTCNRVYDLPIKEPEVPYPKLKGFTIQGHEVVYYGVCSACNTSQ